MPQPPQREDADFDRGYTAEILTVMTMAMMGLSLFYALTAVFFKNGMSLLVAGVVFFIALLSNRICAWGYIRLASVSLSLLLWLAFTLPSLDGIPNGIYNVAFVAYLLPILVAGFIINGRAGLLLALASALVGLIVVLEDINQSASMGRLLHWQALVIFYLMATVMVTVSRRRSLAFLRRLRRDEDNLIEQNVRLQAEIVQRHHVEKMLLARGERLSLALKMAQMDTFHWDSQQDIVHYPDAAPGSAPEYPTYKNFIAAVHPDDRARVQAAIDHCLKDGALYKVDYRIITPSGQVEWYASLGEAVYDSSGIVTGIAGITQEITGRKLIEEKLRTSESTARDFQEQLKTLIEVSAVLASVSSTDALYRQAIELGRERLGFDRIGIWLVDYKAGEMVGTYGTGKDGQLSDEREHRKPLDEASKLNLEILSGKIRVSIERDTALYTNFIEVGRGWNAVAAIWRDDKIVGWVAADNLLRQEPLTDERVQLLALYGSILGHLSLQKYTYQHLQRNEERLQMALQAAQMRTWEWDARTDKTRSYDRHHAGWESEALTMEGYLEYLHPDDRDRVRQMMQNALTRQTSSQWDYRILQPDGSYHWVGVIGQPIMEKETAIGLVGVAYDIQKRKEAEAQALELALQKERNAMLTDFMSSITHDLKTPLSVIRTSLYLLERMVDAEKRKARIDLIESQVAFLDRSLQDILTISRLDYAPALERSPVDLRPMLHAAQMQLAQAAERKGLALNFIVDPDLPAVNGDSDELARVLTNLIENAINYTAHGSVTVRAEGRGNNLCIEVIDTGMGISGAEIERIFNRFYRTEFARQTHDGGTGLGLAIVQRVVDMHDGTIEVESIEGAGSTFRVLLPAFEIE